MKRAIKVLLFAVLAVLSGCSSSKVVFRPSGFADHATRPSTIRKYHISSCSYEMINGDGMPYADAQAEMGVYGLTQENVATIERLFPDVFASDGTPVEVTVRNKLKDFSSGNLGAALYALLSGFSLTTLPMVMDFEYPTEIDVRLANETKCASVSTRQRTFASILCLNLLFPYDNAEGEPFCVIQNGVGSDWKVRYDACREEAFGRAIAQALVAFETEGDGAGRPSESPERSAELKELLDAGVISEEEYRRESERLWKGNGKR